MHKASDKPDKWINGPKGGDSGFVTSFTLLDSLASGRAEELGRVNATNGLSGGASGLRNFY